VATMYYFNCHITFAETALSQSWRFVHSFQLTGALREGRINGSPVITNAVAIVLKSFMNEKVHLYKSFLLRDALLSFLLFWPRECNIRTFSPLDNAQIQVLSFIWPPSWASPSYRWHRSFHTVYILTMPFLSTTMHYFRCIFGCTTWDLYFHINFK
jgi:hypothetical protein